MIVLPRVRFFKNWGRIECQDELSCLSVKNNSKVDTVLGSHLIWPSLRQTESVSKLINSVHPLKPHGSFSAILTTSLATRGRRSAGSSTSPQASWADLAARSSSSRRLASAATAAQSSASSAAWYPLSEMGMLRSGRMVSMTSADIFCLWDTECCCCQMSEILLNTPCSLESRSGESSRKCSNRSPCIIINNHCRLATQFPTLCLNSSLRDNGEISVFYFEFIFHKGRLTLTVLHRT